jgi:hypothetical protein
LTEYEFSFNSTATLKAFFAHIKSPRPEGRLSIFPNPILNLWKLTTKRTTPREAPTAGPILLLTKPVVLLRSTTKVVAKVLVARLLQLEAKTGWMLPTFKR